jgi:hypothetical protein
MVALHNRGWHWLGFLGTSLLFFDGSPWILALSQLRFPPSSIFMIMIPYKAILGLGPSPMRPPLLLTSGFCAHQHLHLWVPNPFSLGSPFAPVLAAIGLLLAWKTTLKREPNPHQHRSQDTCALLGDWLLKQFEQVIFSFSLPHYGPERDTFRLFFWCKCFKMSPPKQWRTQ